MKLKFATGLAYFTRNSFLHNLIKFYILYAPLFNKHFFMLFSDLPIIEPILRAIDDEGYTTPTPIQAAAIPTILS